MQSFRTELENPVVEKDILELERKIFAFRNNQMDGEKFRSLRLARGVYGQRQEGVQMVRIKLPMGKISAQQWRRIASVAHRYGNGNLHLTTRQDIQLHYVKLDDTPTLWAELEQDDITMREACGNTIRNITTSHVAGIDPKEVFDPTPYADAVFNYFLRNPICQDMGRKIKISFSSSPQDRAYSFVHDLGFIPKIENGNRGFQILLGGGIGAQPIHAQEVYSFLKVEETIPFMEAVIRVFDRYGERNRRNKARLKFLVQSWGIEKFLEAVASEVKGLPQEEYPIHVEEESIQLPAELTADTLDIDAAFERWKATNVFPQKQAGLFSVGIPIAQGNIPWERVESLAQIIETYTGNDTRLTIGQSVFLRHVPETHLPQLYKALKENDWARAGFHKVNDIVACPGTDTCNLGIGSSMGLSEELQRVLETDYPEMLSEEDLEIKISGCMNACGQHTLAQIGFQGMSIKVGTQTAPATQILLGGGRLGEGKGRFADKVLKVPARKSPEALRWILDHFKSHRNPGEAFNPYYDRFGKNFFYQGLKHLSETEALTPEDFIDWGAEKRYEKAIGIGECAGVTIDLIQTLFFEAQEALEAGKNAFSENRFADAIYQSYNTQLRAAKGWLTYLEQKTNSQQTIIEGLDPNCPEFKETFGSSFEQLILKRNQHAPDEAFAKAYLNQAELILEWLQQKQSNGKS